MKNKKPEKSKVVWYLALVAFFITIWVIGHFSRHCRKKLGKLCHEKNSRNIDTRTFNLQH